MLDIILNLFSLWLYSYKFIFFFSSKRERIYALFEIEK